MIELTLKLKYSTISKSGIKIFYLQWLYLETALIGKPDKKKSPVKRKNTKTASFAKITSLEPLLADSQQISCRDNFLFYSK